MASPVDASRIQSQTTTANTSHVVNTTNPPAGVLLIVLLRFAAAPGTVTFTGYTPLASDASDASDDQTSIYYRWTDGTEGASDAMTTANSVKYAGLTWRITGAENPAITAPEISAVAVGTTAANSANPASRAVTGGPKDVLYLALAGGDGEVGAYTAAPTNYVNLAATNSGTGGAAATNCFIGGASRAITASSSDDPGAFTHGAHLAGWTAFTVVVHPAGAAFINAAPGSYSVSTATPTGVVAGRVVDAGSGSYSTTGVAATVPVGRAVNAASGSYAVTGTAATVLATHLLNAAPGSYGVTGTTAVLVRGLMVLAAPGSYGLTGIDAGLSVTGSSVSTSAALAVGPKADSQWV
jgi:hypothetical protein